MASKPKGKALKDDRTAVEILSEPPTQFWRQRFPQEMLAKKLKEELDAEETRFFQKDGRVKSQKNVIAWGVRQKARESAHELRGDYPPRKVEAKHDFGPVTVVVKRYSKGKKKDAKRN